MKKQVKNEKKKNEKIKKLSKTELKKVSGGILAPTKPKPVGSSTF